jgi:gliding motility-associated-like protein
MEQYFTFTVQSLVYSTKSKKKIMKKSFTLTPFQTYNFKWQKLFTLLIVVLFSGTFSYVKAQCPVITVNPGSQTMCSEGSTGLVITSDQPLTTLHITSSQVNIFGSSPTIAPNPTLVLVGDSYTISEPLSTQTQNVGTVTYCIFGTTAGCPAGGATVCPIVTVNPKPVVTGSAQTVCSCDITSIALSSDVAGSTISYTVTQAGTVGAVGAGPLAAPTTIAQNVCSANGGSATYHVTATASGCTSDQIDVKLTVRPKPVAVVPADFSICAGSSTSATAFSSSPVSASTTYSWTNSAPSIGIAAAGNGNIPATMMTNATNAPITAAICVTAHLNGCDGLPVCYNITVNPQPIVTNSPLAETICAGATSTLVTLTSNVVGTTFTWTAVASGIGMPPPAASGTSTLGGEILNLSGVVAGTVTYTIIPSANGCPGLPATYTITVNPTPVVSVPANVTVCANALTTVADGTFTSVPAGATFAWTNDNTNIGIAASGAGQIAPFTATNAGAANISGNICVTPTLGTCVGTPVCYSITVKPAAKITNAPLAQTICSGGTTSLVTLTSNIPATFAWSVTSTTCSITGMGVDPLDGTIPAQTLTLGAACIASGTSGTVTIHIIPTAGGCPGIPSDYTFTVNPPPKVITPDKDSVCSGGTTNLILGSGVPGTTFAWTAVPSGGAIIAGGVVAGSGSPIAQTLNVPPGQLTSGTVVYTITPTGPAPSLCPGIVKTVTVKVKPKPIVTATPNPQSICSGATTSIALTCDICGAAPAFDWATPAPNGVGALAGPAFGPGAMIAQTLTLGAGVIAPVTVHFNVATGFNGCISAFVDIPVTVNPIPDVIATPAAQTICSGNAPNIVLTSSFVGTTFDWTVVQNGTIAGASASSGVAIGGTISQVLTNFTATSTAVYTITPKNGSCSGNPVDVTITVNPAPNVISTAPPVCRSGNSNVTLSSSVAGTQFTWTVTNTGANGGTACPGPVPTCGNTIVQPLALNPIGSLVPGTVVYHVTPISPLACPGVITDVTVTVNPIPDVTATPPLATICSGTDPAIALTSNVGGITQFDWTAVFSANIVPVPPNVGSGSPIGQTLTIMNLSQSLGTATYHVTPSIGGVCPGNSIDIPITVTPIPVLATPPAQTICSGTAPSIALSGGVAGTTYTWSVVPTNVSGATNCLGGCGTTIAPTILSCSPPSTQGTAVYTVTPSSGVCVGGSLDVTITVTPAPDVIATPAAQIICSASFTSISLSSSPAFPGTTYAWTLDNAGQAMGGAPSGNGNSIAEVLTNPGPGAGTAVYTITPHLGGCDGTPITVTITVTDPIIDHPTLVLPNCNASDGSISLAPTGGTGAYTYVWTPAALNPAGNNVTNIPAGNYSVIISDGVCSVPYSYSLSNINAPTVTLVSTNVSCNNLCDGTAVATAAGGTPFGAAPFYTFSWTPAAPPITGQGTASISGLCGGTYNLIVTDALGCIAPASVNIINPASIIANAVVVNPTCNGSCNGSIDLNPSGGTPGFLGYTYSWNTGPLTDTLNNLCASGNPYTCIVRDSMNCAVPFVFNLVDPLPIPVTVDTILPHCTSSDGTITVTPTNVTSNYIFTWSAVPAIVVPSVIVSTVDFTSGTQLPAGAYTVTVTESTLGCSTVYPISLNNFGGPTAVFVSKVDVMCNGDSTGMAWIDSIHGGVGIYVPSWNTVPITLNDTAINLSANTYNLTITDGNNCQFISPVTIIEPNPVTIFPNIIPATCSSICDGSIKVTVAGGTPPVAGYTYSWSPVIPVAQGGGTDSIFGLCVGKYILTIGDSLACSHVDSFLITEAHPLAAIMHVTNLNCGSVCNGVASTQVTVGNGLYTYQWNDINSQTNDTAIALCAGAYQVIIRDSLGCSITKDTTLTAAPAITALPTITNAGCGACNGQAVMATAGGTGPLTFLWSNGDLTNTADSLCSGAYQLNISDSIGCTSNFSVLISNTLGPISATITANPASCFGVCDGAVTSVIPFGGTPPYTFNWINAAGQTTSTINNLCAGVYFVQIKDSTGCSFTDSITITEPAAIIVNQTVTAPSACGVADGCITVNPSFCAPPGFIYIWNGNPGLSTNSLCGLSAGIDSVQITCSATGCSQTVIIPISNKNAPILATTSVDPSCSMPCNGTASVAVTSGVPNYTYNWQPGGQTTSTATSLCGGTYFVLVTDGNGCSGISSATLTTPLSIGFNLATTIAPLCNGGTDDTLSIIPFGGTFPYSYIWAPASTPPSTASTASGYAAGVPITVTVTDANGCTAQQINTITQPTALSIVHDSTAASCNTTPDGSVNVTVSGGTPIYHYIWTGLMPPIDNDSLTGVLTATYSVTVTDAHGCIIKDSIFAPAIVSVFANAGRDTTFCQTGTYLLNAAGSSVNVTNYNWFQIQLPANLSVGNSITTTVNPPADTTLYYVQVDNGLGCFNWDTVSVTANPLPDANAGTDVTIITGYSTTIGGSPTSLIGTTFAWSPLVALDNSASANPTVNPPSTIVYTVLVTTAQGCSASDSVIVSVVPNIVHGNGITPNGDGANDEWIIDNIELFPNCNVEVYNRWGELLFQSIGYKDHWKGVFKGQPLPVGTYYYIINLNDSRFPEPETGPITIVR